MNTKKTLGLVAAACVVASAIAAGADSPALSSFSASMQGAKSLKTEYIVQELGGVRDEYQVALKKPNFFRIDSPTQLIVGDGKEVVTLDKKAKTYYRQPETTDLLKELFAPEAYKPWGGFFNPDAYKAFAAKDLGATTKGGKGYEAAEAQVDKAGNKMITYFLDPSDKIARQVEYNAKHGPDTSTTILKTRSLDLGAGGNDSLYTFTAPDGTTEVSLADMLSGKWYLSLAEAEKVAAATHREIFIDFMATWCGPCKMLQNQVLDTEKFKQFAADRKLVLCRIDTDLNPDLMSRYGITAIPVQAVVDENGNMISQTVGYGDPSAFYSWLTGATAPKGN